MSFSVFPVRRQPMFPSPAAPLCHHHQQQQQLQQQQLLAEYHSQRRARTNFTGFQLDTLERTFASGHYPDCAKVAELSYQLSISESRIQVTRICFIYMRLATAGE